MNEKKKIIILISIVVAIILFIIIGSIYENSKSKSYIKPFYTNFEGSEKKLVMIGRENCSWCQLFQPSLEFMHNKYGFEYQYIDINKLTSSTFKKLLKDINVKEEDFGTPLTIVVKDKQVIDSINGYADEQKLLEFLKENEFVDKKAKLTLNYIDYSQYEKILKSDKANIVVIGQTSCTYCMKAKPILNQVAEDYDITINYLNMTELNEENLEKFNTSLKYLQENDWGTPLTLILKKGEVIDTANGLLDYDGYVNLFKNNQIIE